jgi:hypothetical protein
MLSAAAGFSAAGVHDTGAQFQERRIRESLALFAKPLELNNS